MNDLIFHMRPTKNSSKRIATLGFNIIDNKIIMAYASPNTSKNDSFNKSFGTQLVKNRLSKLILTPDLINTEHTITNFSIKEYNILPKRIIKHMDYYISKALNYYKNKGYLTNELIFLYNQHNKSKTIKMFLQE